jgi:hypothetical protein
VWSNGERNNRLVRREGEAGGLPPNPMV